jgi:Flp pilus assembly protein TadB
VDLTLLGSAAAAIAVFGLLMALAPGRVRGGGPSAGERLRAWRGRRVAGARAELARARLELRPEAYLAASVAAPLVGGLAGLALSVPMAAVGLAAGALVPRLYVRYLVGAEARAADEDAPRVLRAMVNRAAAGGTWPDLFAAASEVARHRWVRADFEELLGRYYASEPLAEALAAVRPRQAGRNLALVFDALTVLATTRQPASAAAGVLGALNEAARSNQAIARAAAAESRGLRVQALILAVVIPALFLYLLVTNRELVAPVVDTPVGRFVLLPAAALLEVAGVVLSWRATRLEGA